MKRANLSDIGVMRSRLFAAIGLSVLCGLGIAAPVDAAIRTYTATFSITNIPGPFTTLSGSFVVDLDPTTSPFVNDAVPTSASITSGALSFGPSVTRIDYFPFPTTDSGFLIGAQNGGTDTNNVLQIGQGSDFRVRFILDESLNLISARGGVGNLGSASAFDTSTGQGVASWSVSVSGGAIPEPNTWLMMILGFGFVGSALRRQHATQMQTPASL